MYLTARTGKDEIIKLLMNQSISTEHYDDILDRNKRHKVPVQPNRNFHRQKQNGLKESSLSTKGQGYDYNIHLN